MADRRRDSTFAIRYVTRYAYDSEVADNMNALRVRPAANSRQRVDEFSVRVLPDARLQRHDDYFGTAVVEFEVSRPHRELMIDVRTRVATQVPPAPPRTSWAALDSPSYREAAGEFLFQTDDSPGHPVMDELIAATSGLEDPLAMVMGVAQLIPDRFEYRRGATYVDSPLSAVLDGGAGVCQDFVHLGLCLLRHHGVGARYVSGYLFTHGHDDEPAMPAGSSVPGPGAGSGTAPGSGEASVEVDTHAWIEALLPDADDGGELGDPAWVGIDPTNRVLTGPNHIKIGHGRHYADVPPIKGVYRGDANAELDASVTMTRLDGVDPAASARS